MSTVRDIIGADDEAWEAINKSFLEACSNGSLKRQQFLEQDNAFIDGYIRLILRTSAGAPSDDLATLISLVKAMVEERAWYKDQAKNNNIDLDKTKTTPEVAKYTEHMKDWSNQPYPVLATALWAIEYSYYKVWKEAPEFEGPYKELKNRWSNKEADEAVANLEKLANDSLARADKAAKDEAAKICHRIATLETGFWDMVKGSSGPDMRLTVAAN